MSMTQSSSQTFNIADAKRLTSKVIADMHQCQQFYKTPSDADIATYQEELIVLLNGRYVDRYEFGFKTANDKRVISWRYKVSAAGNLEGGRSGGLYAKADISGSTWFNFMWYSDKWDQLSRSARDAIRGSYELKRGTGDPPADGTGHWVTGAAYVSGGVAMQREEFQPW
jgi:hypothetical protein